MHGVCVCVSAFLALTAWIGSDVLDVCRLALLSHDSGAMGGVGGGKSLVCSPLQFSTNIKYIYVPNKKRREKRFWNKGSQRLEHYGRDFVLYAADGTLFRLECDAVGRASPFFVLVDTLSASPSIFRTSSVFPQKPMMLFPLQRCCLTELSSSFYSLVVLSM